MTLKTPKKIGRANRHYASPPGAGRGRLSTQPPRPKALRLDLRFSIREPMVV